jgi:hypothetical protein
MVKQFRISETNLEGVADTHFVCETQIGKKSTLFEQETPFQTFMFDGIKVKLIRGGEYVIGEVHGNYSG